MTVYKFNENVTPAPKPQPRKGEGRMKAAAIQSVMHGLVQDAINLVDMELSPERAQATDYYLGKPLGNEEEGRSQIVITEVRDAVHGVLPSLMRIFTGPEHVVEYAARNEQSATSGIDAQATDYAQYVFMEDNKGFLRTYDVLKDGLVRKLGAFKAYWDASTETSYREEGMSDDDVERLAARDDVTITLAEESDAESYGADDAPEDTPPESAATPGATGKTWTIEYTVKIDGKPCIVAVPPEEILFNREARDPDDALLIAHRTRKRRGELVALGIDEDELEEYGQADHSLGVNVEAVERNLNVNIQQGQDPEAGEANDLILYIEAYAHLDVDGDGEAELRRIRMIGPGYHVCGDPEPVDGHPFAFFTPYPEPHTMIGQSMADLTMDLQLVKSNITRSMNDSLALSIYPRTAFVDGMVSVEDLLNNEIGAPIRMKAPGMAQPFTHDFAGDKAMSVLEYFDAVSENRIGRKGTLGLDADVLQSSTDQAVQAAVGAAQEQTEMIARIFAEQTFKPLFRLIYKLLVEHKPAPRLIKLRGQYVQIDTATWDADMDVVVTVALGTTDTAKRLARLQAIAERQEQIISTMGPQNPICTLAQYANTLRKITELGGERAVSSYFSAVDPSWQPPPAPPPPPSPEQVLAQAQIQNEQIKTQKDLEIKRAELSLKQQSQEFDHELQIRKMAQDFVLRRYAIDAEWKANFTQADLERDAAAEEAALKGATTIADMRHRHAKERAQFALDAQSQAHDQALSRAGMELDAETQRAAAAAPDTAGSETE